ncbi:hypothetical protein CQW23_03563 [Capsicum baccatum]|uniref:Ubiquitin-like protease family profile domain-containing protein n=1 Tax=Capsicum baccatum TaxID=33114 RepID=A0A2G2XC69_CAPBA|nr:hypothetical protein CQW23_03563 [Capsicum baccatum]
MPFFLTLRSVQILSDPKVIDRIKIKLFKAIVITRKIILEGGLVVVDDGSGSGSGATVEANDAPLIVFEKICHYDYDHTSYTDFAQDFATSSECSACKCQDCKAKYDGVINAINTLTTSVKEMTSKRGVIPTKRISYSYTPLHIKVAKRRRKDIFKTSSSIKKSKITMPLSLSYTVVQCTRATWEKHELKKVDVIVEVTAEEHNITGDNPSTASKEEEKVEPVTGLLWHLVDEVYIPINCGDEFHWVLAVVVLKVRHIRVYDLIPRRERFEPSSEIQKLAKILPTYIDMSGFLDKEVRTDWSMIEAYRDKMGNPFDI